MIKKRVNSKTMIDDIKTQFQYMKKMDTLLSKMIVDLISENNELRHNLALLQEEYDKICAEQKDGNKICNNAQCRSRMHAAESS